MNEQGDFLREYRDVFTIRIELGSVYEPIPSEVFEVRHDSSKWSRDDAVDVLELLTQDERLIAATGVSDSGGGVPFTLDIRRSITDWGASGAAEELVLRIAEWAVAGVVGNAAYAAIQEVLRRFGHETEDIDGIVPETELERDHARSLAEWGISEKFKLPLPVDYVVDPSEPSGMREVRDTSLVLVEELLAEGRWFFAWHRPPHRYEASVEIVAGFATLTHFRRSTLA